MTFRRRRRLERLAYPDPVRFARLRRRVRWLLIAAAALAVAHLFLAAVFIAAFALPDMAFWVRRELALGALLAAGRETPKPPVPDRDMREIYRRV